VATRCCSHVRGRLSAQKEISFLPHKKGGAAHSPPFLFFSKATNVADNLPTMRAHSNLLHDASWHLKRTKRLPEGSRLVTLKIALRE
jgi:hypothetical protein